jgi:putative spermidine/putrescine transport system ATP-binding protein
MDVAFLGSVIRIRARLLGAVVEFDTFNQPDVAPPAPGAQVTVSLNGRDLLALPD